MLNREAQAGVPLGLDKPQAADRAGTTTQEKVNSKPHMQFNAINITILFPFCNILLQLLLPPSPAFIFLD